MFGRVFRICGLMTFISLGKLFLIIFLNFIFPYFLFVLSFWDSSYAFDRLHVCHLCLLHFLSILLSLCFMLDSIKKSVFVVVVQSLSHV